MSDTIARIVAEIDTLPAVDLERLVLKHLNPSALRRRRLAERDEAIRAARAFFAQDRPTVAAREMETALSRYLASQWLRDRDLAALPDGASAMRRALHRVARLNGGEAIGWRQLSHVLDGNRGR